MKDEWTRDAEEIGHELGCLFPTSVLTNLAELLGDASEACDYAAEDMAERAHYERNHCGSDEEHFANIADCYSNVSQKLSLLAHEIRKGEIQGREDHPS